MEGKICLLLGDSPWEREFMGFLRNTGCDLNQVERVREPPGRVHAPISSTVEVLVIDALFCGSVELTADFVHSLRVDRFRKPIVVLDEREHPELTHPVLTSGANYRVPRSEATTMAASLAEYLDALAPIPRLPLEPRAERTPSLFG